MSFRISQLGYNVTLVQGTAPPKYDLSFLLPSVGIPYDIRIYREGMPQYDSSLTVATAGLSIAFNGLSEEEAEGLWNVSWHDTSGGSLISDTLTVPDGAITSTTEQGGLDPTSSAVTIRLSGEQSPYVTKRLKLRGFKLKLESFSVGAEYNPVKTYTIPDGARALLLEVNDYVPSSFGGGREDWILYSFIIGNEVYPVTPKNRPGNNPAIYHLNSTLTGPARAARKEDGSEGFIDSDSGKITRVGVKIELGRPEDQASSTPVVFGYKLKYISYD